MDPFIAAPFIKEIGRGVKGARSLSRADAHDLFAAMLAGRVSDLEMGAILLSMRIKGESVDEITGFLQAAEASFESINAPDSIYAPIVIPTYNGARRAANLTPLLALLLARAGAPVLAHGVQTDAGRVTTAEILGSMKILPSSSVAHAERDLAEVASHNRPVFVPIEILAPRLEKLLALRKILGLRNSTHTLVKIMQPFKQPALRLTSYTHPEYLSMLSEYFVSAAAQERGDVFLMRGTEGETVASIKKVQQIDWFHAGQKQVLVEAQIGTDLDLGIPPDAQGTAEWIRSVLDGEKPVPDNIAQQVEHCLSVAKRMKQVA
ncbi:DNA-binding protein YbiB [Sapientia aquatica]|uniref:DNA-binding protein YbiB n=1 Tax=Sapientia aquatica TaxID=1549640 RepID=A0A4R5W1T6_9BURK|nr:DNA-binding protein YbiB [Sapientia aquatica]TDK66366.1 DNA-binding protein YbiB [Sapientia aquatica]